MTSFEDAYLVQLVARSENDGRQEEVEEELVIKRDVVLDELGGGKSQDETNDHA